METIVQVLPLFEMNAHYQKRRGKDTVVLAFNHLEKPGRFYNVKEFMDFRVTQCDMRNSDVLCLSFAGISEMGFPPAVFTYYFLYMAKILPQQWVCLHSPNRDTVLVYVNCRKMTTLYLFQEKMNPEEVSRLIRAFDPETGNYITENILCVGDIDDFHFAPPAIRRNRLTRVTPKTKKRRFFF